MRTALIRLLVLLVLSACLVVWWLQSPIGQPGRILDLRIEVGSGASKAAHGVAAAGAQVNPWVLSLWFRLSGRAREIHAGSYEIESELTPLGLLDKLVNGRQALRGITLVEGWTFRQLRAVLNQHPDLRHDTQDLSDTAVMQRIGRQGIHPEGRFFPDTYRFAKNSSDLEVLQSAAKAMERELGRAWDARSSQSTLKNPTELLILASIVEKETGAPEDRTRIAGVFHNRLRSGMLLQTDPTVIYGLGERFDGNLRKADLLRDSPYNTYTRPGLPPSPISNPGAAALLAAAKPAHTDAIYFVARGDGSSQFSATLDEHNRAVNKYQRP